MASTLGTGCPSIYQYGLQVWGLNVSPSAPNPFAFFHPYFPFLLLFTLVAEKLENGWPFTTEQDISFFFLLSLMKLCL